MSEKQLVSSVSFNDAFDIGLGINCTLLSKKFVNINSPLNFLCNICGHKFMESYSNIKSNNKGCLKCAYNKFNKKNKK